MNDEINVVISTLYERAEAAKGSGELLDGLKGLWDFDPAVIPDPDYPAISFEWAGDPETSQPHANMDQDSFDINATLYTSAHVPGDAAKQLRKLARQFKAWLRVQVKTRIPMDGVAITLKIGRAQTGLRRIGHTFTAACSYTIHVNLRGQI